MFVLVAAMVALGVCLSVARAFSPILAKRVSLQSRTGLTMKATMSSDVYADLHSVLKPERASYRVPLLPDLESSEIAHHGRVNSVDFGNRRYILREEMDGEHFSNIVELEDNGEVKFLETSRGDAKKITGAWSVDNNMIHMAVSCTHASRFAEYTVTTQFFGKFLGRVEDTPSTNPVMGEIRLDNCDEDDRPTTGSFSLHGIGDSKESSEKKNKKNSSAQRRTSSSVLAGL